MSENNTNTQRPSLFKRLFDGLSWKAPKYDPPIEPDPLPDNIVDFIRMPDLDECLLKHSCGESVFYITQAYNVKCCKCHQVITNVAKGSN